MRFIRPFTSAVLASAVLIENPIVVLGSPVVDPGVDLTIISRQTGNITLSDDYHTQSKLGITEACAIIGVSAAIGAWWFPGLGNNIAGYVYNTVQANKCYAAVEDFRGANGQTVKVYYDVKPGADCYTTALYKTIFDALKVALPSMQDRQMSRGCVEMRHGGKWVGQLHITVDGYNPSYYECEDPIKYDAYPCKTDS